MDGTNATTADKAQVGSTALLDTSAFKALSKDHLAEARWNGWHLTTSPYCFWELLCHLDEQANFAKGKGNLMKYRGVEIIDKPLDRVVVGSELPKEPRIWSSDLTYAALAAIDAANSLDDLNNSLIVDEGGNRRALGDCADRVHRQLADEEERFREFMAKLIELLRSGQVTTRTEQEKHNAIMSMVVSGGSSLPDTADLDYVEGASEDQVFACSYVYWAYALLRSSMLADAGGSTCAENDFEDGQLCAYVPLDEPMWVVAGDRELRCRISEARQLLIAVGLGKRACFEPAKPDLLLQGGPS